MGRWQEGLIAGWSWFKNDLITPLFQSDNDLRTTLNESVQIGMGRLCTWADAEDTWLKFHAEVPCNLVPKSWEVARQVSNMSRIFTITTSTTTSTTKSTISRGDDRYKDKWILQQSEDMYKFVQGRNITNLSISDLKQMETRVLDSCGHSIGQPLFDHMNPLIAMSKDPRSASLEYLDSHVLMYLPAIVRDADMIQYHRDRWRKLDSGSGWIDVAVGQSNTLSDECNDTIVHTLEWLERIQKAHQSAWYNLLWIQHSFHQSQSIFDYKVISNEHLSNIELNMKKKMLLLGRGSAIVAEFRRWSNQFDAFVSVASIDNKRRFDDEIGEQLEHNIEKLKERIASATETVQMVSPDEIDKIIEEHSSQRIRRLRHLFTRLYHLLKSGLEPMWNGSTVSDVAAVVAIDWTNVKQFLKIQSFIQSFYVKEKTTEAINNAYHLLEESSLVHDMFRGPLRPVYNDRVTLTHSNQIDCGQKCSDGCDSEDDRINIIPQCLQHYDDVTLTNYIQYREPDDNPTESSSLSWPFARIESGFADERMTEDGDEVVGGLPGRVFTTFLNQFDMYSNWSFTSWFHPMLNQQWIGDGIKTIESKLMQGKQLHLSAIDQWMTGLGGEAYPEEDWRGQLGMRSERFWKTQASRFSPGATCDRVADYLEANHSLNREEWTSYLSGAPLGASGFKMLSPVFPLRKLIFMLHVILQDNLFNQSHSKDSRFSDHDGNFTPVDHKIPQRDFILEAIPFGAAFRAICQPVKFHEGQEDKNKCNDPKNLRFGVAVAGMGGAVSFTPSGSFRTENWRSANHPVLYESLDEVTPDGAFNAVANRVHTLVNDCLDHPDGNLFKRQQFPYAIPGIVTFDQPKLNGRASVAARTLQNDLERPIDDCVPFFALLMNENENSGSETDACRLSVNLGDHDSKYCFPRWEKRMNRSNKISDENDTFKCKENERSEECYWCAAKFVDLQLDTFRSFCQTAELEVPGVGRLTLEESGNVICQIVAQYKHKPPTNDESEINLSINELATIHSQETYKDSQLSSDEKAKYWNNYFNLKYHLSEMVSLGINKTTAFADQLGDPISRDPVAMESMLDYLFKDNKANQISYLDWLSYLLTAIMKMQQQLSMQLRRKIVTQFWIMLIGGWLVVASTMFGKNIYRLIHRVLIGGKMAEDEAKDLQKAIESTKPQFVATETSSFVQIESCVSCIG
eukprot:GHVH01003311.1.p1 GENE.GHVH01003311.1~~GHVH01003311.1.p1  ORF type:complete len:1192 (-),score=179.22 GHVH01003311.1:2515-6090(-)